MKVLQFVVLACLTCCGCASTPRTLVNPRGQDDLTLESGDACAFVAPEALCIYAHDTDDRFDLSPTIFNTVKVQASPVATCHEGWDRQLTIQYSSGSSTCTHCDSPYHGPRFATASLAMSGKRGTYASALWQYTKGGSRQEVLFVFLEHLRRLLRGKSALGSCGYAQAGPPNPALQRTRFARR